MALLWLGTRVIVLDRICPSLGQEQFLFQVRYCMQTNRSSVKAAAEWRRDRSGIIISRISMLAQYTIKSDAAIL